MNTHTTQSAQPKRVNKWVNEYTVQGFYCGHWEDVTAEDNRPQARERLKEYRENERGTVFRIVTRRVLNPLYVATVQTVIINVLVVGRYPITTQAQVRESFWDAHPEFKSQYRATKRQNQYPTDIRCSFVDYVDMLRRDGQISEALANRVTL